MWTVAAVWAAAACAAGPRPGAAGYAYNVDGRYVGRLMVESQPFDASFELTTDPAGRVEGSFRVLAPLDVEGTVVGRVIDDLLRLTLTYEGSEGAADVECAGRVEGILTVGPGGSIVDGPVTIDDCGEEIPGRLSIRRAPPGS